MRLHLAVLILVAAAYAAGSQMAYSWFGADGVTASFFPAAGVSLSALVLAPRRLWPTILLAVAGTEASLDVWHDLGLAASLGYAGANAVQAVVGAVLLRTWSARPDLRQLADLGAFLVAAVLLAPLVGGILGATTVVVLGDGDNWLRFAVEWWVGDGLGVLVVGAAVLSLAQAGGASSRSAPPWEGMLLAVGTVLATAMLFWLRWTPMAFPVVALLLLLAFRHGTRAVALTGLAAALVAAQAASEGHAYWDALEISPATGVVYVQAALAVLVCVALALAAQVGAREEAVVAWAEAEAARRESDRSHRRSEQMRTLAESLSTAVTVGEVGEAFLRAAVPKVQASAGALMVVSDDRERLETR